MAETFTKFRFKKVYFLQPLYTTHLGDAVSPHVLREQGPTLYDLTVFACLKSIVHLFPLWTPPLRFFASHTTSPYGDTVPFIASPQTGWGTHLGPRLKTFLASLCEEGTSRAWVDRGNLSAGPACSLVLDLAQRRPWTLKDPPRQGPGQLGRLSVAPDHTPAALKESRRGGLL